ncbi:hypothetical protein [Tardiphaga sp. P5_C7]
MSAIVVLDKHYFSPLYLSVMASLKSFLPVLAETFGTTPDALYSRQRALVRMGLLPSNEGKGPGSGVVLNADTLAVMLIAIMAADTLAETDGRVARLCEATVSPYEFDDTDKSFADAKTFRQAVAAVIAEGPNPPGNHFVKSIRVSRDRGQLVLVENTGRRRKMLTKTYLTENDHSGGKFSRLIHSKELIYAAEAGIILMMMRFAEATGSRFFSGDDE